MDETASPSKHQICRLCLETTSTSFSLLLHSEAAKMLQALTAMIISPDDEISTMICKQCSFHLKVAYDIQQFMLGAERRFKEQISRENEPKLESIEVETEIVVDTHICEVCGEVKPSKSALLAHKITHLPKSELKTSKAVKKTICETCGVQVPRQRLAQHMSRAHSNTQYKCQYCDKFFRVKLYRDTHEIRVHIGEANFVCQTCGKKFYAKHDLRAHRRKTHKFENYPCDVCDSTFSSKHEANNHKKHHEVRECFKCEFCDMLFLHKVSLTKHLRKKHETDVKQNECSECGKWFVSERGLQSHIGKEHLKNC